MQAIPSTSSRISPGRRSVIAETAPRLRLIGISGGVDQRQGHLDHRLEVVDGDVLVGGVDLHHPVPQVQAREARSLKTLASAPPPVRWERLVAAAVERVAASPTTGRSPEAVTLVRLAHLGLEGRSRPARREGEGVEHLADQVGELAVVVGARRR